MNALVTGGSSGIGLSIVLNLIRKADLDKVYFVDKMDYPNEYADEKVVFSLCDLSKNVFSVFQRITDIQALFITAGFGYLKFFQDLSEDYIQDSFAVNAVAPIQIIRIYYDHFLSKENFYCAVMVSIAAHLVSPMFSVYSAAKAALSKFVEAVNVELDVQGSKNRILEVSPGSLKGTSFTGSTSQPELTASLAKEIIERSKKQEELFIPQYDEVFKGVLERYHSDPHKYGIESYWYKKRLGRV